MSLQWKRWFSLTIGDSGGTALEFNRFRAAFKITQWDSTTPNIADITIYNLAPSTAARIRNEFTQVQVMAGYAGDFGVIFKGSIIQSAAGRENPVDTYVRITAQDPDMAHTYAVVNQTMAAGSTPAQVHAAACTAMDPYGVSQGYTAPFGGAALPRGRVLYGMARDIMTVNAASAGMQWTVVDGRVQVIPQGGYLPSEAVLLTSQTGLIGMPTITMDGIMVRCLLNPNLRVMGRIKLDNASIQPFILPTNPLARAQLGADTQQPAAPQTQTTRDGRRDVDSYGAPTTTPAPGLSLVPSTQADGIYRILAIDHVGDTRGQPWYSEIVCMSADPNAIVPPGQITRGRGGPAPLPQQPVTAGATPAALDPASPDFNPRYGEQTGGGLAMQTFERVSDQQDLYRRMMDAHQAGIWTAMPGVIQTFSPATCTATVQPAIMGKRLAQDGTVSDVAMPVCADVPVHFQGGGGFHMTFPVAAGDECLLIFCARCIDGWWSSGRNSPQLDGRKHSLSDAIALVGLSSAPKVPPSVSGSAVQLRSTDGGQVFSFEPGGVVSLTATTIQLNGNLEITGGSVTHNGKHIDDTHTHNAPAGGGTTSVPN